MEERLSRQVRRRLAKLQREVDPAIFHNGLVSLDQVWDDFGGPDGTQVTRDDAEYLWRRNHLLNQRFQGEQLSTNIEIPNNEGLARHFEFEAVQLRAGTTQVGSQHLPELRRRITACEAAIKLFRS